MATVGSGYDYEFLEAIADRCNCGICFKVLRDAQLTVCCGHHYCETCLKQWLASTTHGVTKSCPHCREESFQSVPNKAIIREIKEFKIRCSHREKGCEWVGELGALKDHLDSDKGCEYVEVECKNDAHRILKAMAWRSGLIMEEVNCKAVMERRNFLHHQENECVYRQYTCEYCGYTDTYDAIAGSGWIRNKDSSIKFTRNHYQECAEYPMDCPNKYGKKGIKSKDLGIHRNGVCPLEPVKCNFCHCTILRKGIGTHKKECEYRPYKCRYCGRKGRYRTINDHYGECSEYPLECSNNCGRDNVKRKYMKAHRESCPLEPLDCPLCPRDESALTEDTCGRVPRRDMEKHKNEECPHRPYKCQYCGQEGTYRSIAGVGSWRVPCHYHDCQHYPLKCYQCGEEGIKRKDMKEHQDTTCPLEFIVCPFKNVGCTAGKIKRKDMDSHCQENIQQYLLLSYQELARKNEELERKNEKLDRKNAELERKNEELAAKVD